MRASNATETRGRGPRLPSRRPLLVLLATLLPAYLVLWITGSACIIDDVKQIESDMIACSSQIKGHVDQSLPAKETKVLSVKSGVYVNVPAGNVGIGGNTSQTTGAIDVGIRHRDGSGGLQSLSTIMLHQLTPGFVQGSGDLPDLPVMPGDWLDLLIDPEVEFFGDYSGYLSYSQGVFSIGRLLADGRGLRFPPAEKVKYQVLFDAEFGIDYTLPSGPLTIEGTATSNPGKVPKKVLVEITHLDLNGKIVDKHKQVLKIKKGKIKKSTKKFKGYDVAEGERVRVRLKPKKGTLDGVDWLLMSSILF